MSTAIRQLGTRGRSTAIVLVLACLLALAGCADDTFGAEMSDSGGTQQPPQPTELTEAESSMRRHDLATARELYAEALDKDESNAQAAAGKAITDILLLPYSEAFDAIVTQNLGGSHGLGEKRDVIFGEQGLLHLLSLGVPWEDNGGLSGIQTQLTPDLPWTDEQLESPQTLAATLDDPVNSLADNLVAVADSLEDVEANLDRALDADSFGVFFVPGAAFHDEDLSLFLGKSELSWLRAGVSATRAVIYFAAAYEHDWTLAAAFGDHWDDVMANPGEYPDEYVEDFQYEDYAIRYLDGELGRAIRDGQRLRTSKKAAADALRFARRGIAEGIGTSDTTLDWVEVDETFAEELTEILEALEASLDGPTQLPFSEPATTIDLSIFFADGRTLDRALDWWTFSRVTDSVTGEMMISWEWNDEATQRVFIDGVFDPSFDPDNPPELQTSGDSEGFGSVSGGIERDVEDAYFSTR